MRQNIQQTYRHVVQQHIVQQHIVQAHIARREQFPAEADRDARSEERTHKQGVAWEVGGVLALFAAAAASGILAQIHLG